MRAIVCAAAAVCFLSAPAFAQPPDDHFQVPLRFDHGRLVTDCARASMRLSDRYRSLLRPGVTDAELTTQFCAAIDRELQSMPMPYVFTLTDAEKQLDREGKLTDPRFEVRRRWNGPIREFPGLRALLEGRSTGFNAHLVKVTDHSALAAWVNEEEGAFDGPFLFRLREPLATADLTTPRLGTILDRERVLRLLEPLERLPANPAQVHAALLSFFDRRNLRPVIELRLDDRPPSLSIHEVSRIARILLPADLADAALARRIAYDTLPDALFRAFRTRAPELLEAAVAPGATHREIALEDLSGGATVAAPAAHSLPVVDPILLAQMQERLLPAGHTASLVDFRPEERLVDLVIERVPDAAGQAAQRAGAPDKNFAGGGFEYRPEQKVRVFGTYRRVDMLGDDQFGIEVGTMGSVFVTGSYSRDYLFFPALGRRLRADVSAGSDFQTQRLIDNLPTDERRTGGAVRGELELFRERSGRHLSVFAEARRETVSLASAEPDTTPREPVSANLTTLDAGFFHLWRRRFALRPMTLRIEPSLRLGLGTGAAQRSYGRLRITAQYHQLLLDPIEVESRINAQRTSADTPVFELPSLGGADTVRGFRADELVGRRLWAWQNEVWVPIPSAIAPARLRDFVRLNVRLAVLYDAGRLTGAAGLPAAREGLRHGAGVGLRVRYQGVIIEADWAYGFGNDRQARPGRGRFHFNFRL